MASSTTSTSSEGRTASAMWTRPARDDGRFSNPTTPMTLEAERRAEVVVVRRPLGLHLRIRQRSGRRPRDWEEQPCFSGHLFSRGRPGGRGVAGASFERVRVAGQARRLSGVVRSPAVWQAGLEDSTERRGALAGDPDGVEGESVPGRGTPEGEGAACGQGDPGRQEPGAEADARASVGSASPVGTAFALVKESTLTLPSDCPTK